MKAAAARALMRFVSGGWLLVAVRSTKVGRKRASDASGYVRELRVTEIDEL